MRNIYFALWKEKGRFAVSNIKTLMKKQFLLVVLILLIGQMNLLFSQTTIIMQKEGGVFTVPCTVNGLKLKFIFDTGASDVSISLTEALFMLENGYLNTEDIFGKQYYTDATGDISVGTKIILREIEFADLKLYNVNASVVSELSAPLLLGQSAISKLGTFQLDPNNGALTILNTTNKIKNSSEEKKQPIVEVAPSNSSYNSNNTNNTTVTPDASNSKTTKPTQTQINSSKTFSGTVIVYTFSPILDKPETNAKQVGTAVNNKVTIIRKENKDYYYVTSGTITGYLYAGFIAEDTWVIPETTQKKPAVKSVEVAPPIITSKKQSENEESTALAEPEIIFVLKGNIYSDSGKSAEGVSMELKKNGQTIVKTLSDINGKYYLRMRISIYDKNHEYLLYVTQAGTMPKTLSINTYIPQEEYHKDNFIRYDFSLQIVQIATSVKDIVLNHPPSGKIHWDNTQHRFAFSQTKSD